MTTKTSLLSRSRSERFREGDRVVPHRAQASLRLPKPTRGEVALIVLGGLLGYLLGGGSLGAGLLNLVLVLVVAFVVFLVAKVSVPIIARRMHRYVRPLAPTITIVGAAIFVTAVVLAEFAILGVSIGMGLVVAIGAILGWRFYVRKAVRGVGAGNGRQGRSTPYAAHAVRAHRRRRSYR